TAFYAAGFCLQYHFCDVTTPTIPEIEESIYAPICSFLLPHYGAIVAICENCPLLKFFSYRIVFSVRQCARACHVFRQTINNNRVNDFFVWEFVLQAIEYCSDCMIGNIYSYPPAF